jgi:glycosyltransferase involved in cell wall biosynthesis
MNRVGDRILLFIPMYNCSLQIGRVVAQLDARVRSWLSEVLMVDNGSSDGSRETARDALQKLADVPWRVVRNRENYNLGGSHKVAFNYAIEHGFSHVIVLHGDDQADIHDFLLPLGQGLHNGYDALLGARFMRGSTLHGYSLFRTVGNYGLNTLCGLMVRRWIADQGSGLNMYRTSYLKSRFYLPFDNSLIFPNQLFFYGVESGSSFRFIPISWREEDQRSNAKAVEQGLRVLKLVWNRRSSLARRDTPFAKIDYAFDVVYEGTGA